jgi:sugar lactone lactonase YvrE
MKAPKGGGAATVLASAQQYPAEIAVLGATVYWLDSPPLAGVDGTLMKMPTTGGTPTTLATGLVLAGGLAVSPQGIYWTNWGSGTVMRLPLIGGTPVKIGSGAMPQAIAVDATNVYWSDIGSQRIMKAPLEGGPATLVVSESRSVTTILLDATTIYWGAGAIKKMPIGGGDVTVLASSGADWLATDAKSIYWSTDEAIYKAPK